MIDYNLAVFSILLIVPITCSDELPSVPRGVPTSKLSLYNPLKDFTCFDGLLTVPFNYINDDYCDCLDGSDEPGTPACPTGLFYCANKGYSPLTIPSSRVNDGFCDCCDASDEYLTNNCTNNCEELGRVAKEAADLQAKLIEQGNLLRLQLVAAAKKSKQSKQERLASLESEKNEAQKLKDETERAKLEIEAAENAALQVYREREEAIKKEKAEQEKAEARNEAEEAFVHLDSNGDKVVQIDEIKSRQTFDQNKDGQVSEEEIQFFLGNDKTEADLEYFIETVWPRVKPLYMLERGLFVPPKTDVKEEEEAFNGEDDAHNDNQPEDDEETEDEDARDENWEKEHDGEENENAHEPEKPADETLEYDDKTKALIEEANQARSHYESASRSLQELEQELTKLKDTLAKDYGAEDEFAPLDGQCFSYSDREYTYKLCPFDQVIQSSKSGSSETRLGSWTSWGEEGSYDVMHYTKGQGCWNGPQRSTKVIVTCGLDNALTSASEPNKCEYLLEFQTPAACRPAEKVPDQHDEL